MMKEEIWQKYNEKSQQLVIESALLYRLAEMEDISVTTLTEKLNTFKGLWKELFYQYRLLLEFGYQSNNKFLEIEKRLDELEQQQLLRQLHEATDITELKLKMAIQFEGIQQLLQQECTEWPQVNKKPFLVELWSNTLKFLEKISVFYLIRNVLMPNYTKGNYRFVDSWLLFHTFLALIYVVIANVDVVPVWIKYTLLIYGCLRMFEILIYQLNVILVHPYNNANYSLNSYRRMTIALIHNFFEIIFWFAGTFITLQFITDSTVPLAVYTSFTHMVTYSMELDDKKWSMVAVFILQFQALIGVFMTILSLARFVSLFPQPASQDPKEQEANEQRHYHLLNKLIVIEKQVNENITAIANNKKAIEQSVAKSGTAEERTGENDSVS